MDCLGSPVIIIIIIIITIIILDNIRVTMSQQIVAGALYKNLSHGCNAVKSSILIWNCNSLTTNNNNSSNNNQTLNLKPGTMCTLLLSFQATVLISVVNDL